MRPVQIPDATRAVLCSFVERSIRPEVTAVFTDAWGSCKAPAPLGIDHRPRKGEHGRQALDDALAERIRRAIRERATPRHVPARILPVDDIPCTRSGKKVGVAVRGSSTAGR